MTVEAFAILDMVAEQYMEPFFTINAQTALRGFSMHCAEDGHQFNKFPEDYALYHVGSWNGSDGVFTPLEPRKIGQASSFVVRHEPEHGSKIDIEEQLRTGARA